MSGLSFSVATSGAPGHASTTPANFEQNRRFDGNAPPPPQKWPSPGSEIGYAQSSGDIPALVPFSQPQQQQFTAQQYEQFTGSVADHHQHQMTQAHYANGVPARFQMNGAVAFQQQMANGAMHANGGSYCSSPKNNGFANTV